MKKRITVIIAAALMMISTAACSKVPESRSSTPTASSVVSDSSKPDAGSDESSTKGKNEENEQQSSQPESKTTQFEYWTEDSPTMKSIMSFVSEVTDEKSDRFVPEAERIAVFDSDGTLYGELFPTYVDQCLMIYRLVHDDTYKGADEDVEYCRALEQYLLNGGEKPKAPRSSGDIISEAFKGFTVEEYRDYIRNFMSKPVAGFENMTYADGYYKPMISLVKYLTENGFKVYINSGAEVNLLRELSKDALGEYIPPYQVIGTRYGFKAEGQEDTKARDYTPAPDEKITFDGTSKFKNLKLNKVVSIFNDLGISPLLAFGNSSGDLAMGQYVIRHGGKAYMLLCDDTERDHGDIEEAASFKEDCDKLGIETVSMKNEFTTIYGDFKLAPYSEEKAEESVKPAA